MSQAAEWIQDKNDENMWTLKYYIAELLFASFEWWLNRLDNP